MLLVKEAMANEDLLPRFSVSSVDGCEIARQKNLPFRI